MVGGHFSSLSTPAFKVPTYSNTNFNRCTEISIQNTTRNMQKHFSYLQGTLEFSQTNSRVCTWLLTVAVSEYAIKRRVLRDAASPVPAKNIFSSL
jgi:hypothetical protein